MDDPIRIFVTGGTFDKEYDYITGKLFFKKTHLQEMFERGRCTLDINVTELMMMDSLDITSEHREIILSACRTALEENVIITHGTDTIVETAQVLAEANIENKTIVLTGAMIPYAFGTSSDGFFNLGGALAYSKVLNTGVYICMNGQYFEWDKVRKNRTTGFFEAI